MSWDDGGLHIAMHADGTPLHVTLEEDLIAIVDPESGETTPHADLPDAGEVTLVDWLGSEMDEELLTGTREDDYLLAGRRYWTCLYLCPYADCACHKARLTFFPDDAKDGSGETVGSVQLDLGGAADFKITEIAAECETPDHVIRELWTLFERRHHVEAFLRRREAGEGGRRHALGTPRQAGASRTATRRE